MKIKIKLDASAMVKSACMLRLKRLVIDGYSGASYNDIQYGSAYHEFVKQMYLTKANFAIAIEKALEILNKPCIIRKKHLTDKHLTKTCLDYWQYSKSNDNYEIYSLDGKPMVEIYFENKFFEDDKYEVYLVGTIDSFGKIDKGIYAIRDFKTHSLFSVSKSGSSYVEQEMQTFLNSFELSLQLRFYLLNLKLLSKAYPDTEFSKIVSHSVGMFIDGVFLSSKEPTQFRRSTIWIPNQDEICEIEFLLNYQIKRFLCYLDRENFNLRDGIITGACTDGKFPCNYYEVCAAKDQAKDYLLKNNFVKKPYEPQEFGK